MALPEHLELLVTDEPVCDYWATGPWRVPDGLFAEIRDRVETLVNDPRCKDLTTDDLELLTAPSPLVLGDLVLALEFLGGGSAVCTGSHSRLQYQFFGRYHREPRDLMLEFPAWIVTSGNFRPLEWLGDSGDKELALTLARESLDVLEGIEPLEPRRRALARLLADPPPTLDITDHLVDQRQAWMDHASDEIIAALPELAGPIGYLEWICAGLTPAHEHLRSAAPREESVQDLYVHLLLQGGLREVPAELSAVLGENAYGELLERFAHVRDTGFDASEWSEGVRAWLARALGAGEADACRGWLDMAVRFTGSVQGLPADCDIPDPQSIPVSQFQYDLRRLFRPRRRVVNPLASSMGKGTPRSRRPRASAEVGSDLVGQPDVVAALARIAEGDGPVRLMLVGPDGTGKRDAAQHVARLLLDRGVTSSPLWLADDFFAGKEVSAATTHLYNDARESAGSRLMVIDGLDDMSRDPRSGEAIVEELHRALDVHDDLHVVALCEPGGDERIREVNPALSLRFEVVHTRPFSPDAFAELFSRALAARGARAHKRALTAAGDLLARTPAVRNLRNARLAQRLADVIVADVRARTAPGEEPVVKRADIPARFDAAGTASDPHVELDALVGLAPVKKEIELMVAGANAARLRRDAGLPAGAPSRHMLFTGNPGTGKTEVARLLARLYKDLGILSSGHLVEVSRAQLVGQYLGETAVKTREVVRRAVGGVLFIDEAYALAQSDLSEDYGPEAVAELVKMMEDHRDDLVVVAAGYEREMQRFVASDPGLASRFPVTVRFPDFTDTELVEIFSRMCATSGLTLTGDASAKVADLLRRAPRGRSFGNARLMRNLCERAQALQARRVTSLKRPSAERLAELLPADIPDSLTGTSRAIVAADPLGSLDALVGLRDVKTEVHRLAAEARSAELRRAAGRPAVWPTRHMVFSGGPGTAKTTVARLVAAVHADLGLLSSGHLVEVARGDLVGGYLGQTAPRVKAAVEQALGGVLFIDEAYALGSDAYGAEAVATLVKLMEEYRGDLLVITAGYEREMTAFLAANPGLESRFPKRLRFPDYTDSELVQIFEVLAAADGLTLAPGVREALRALLATVPRGPSFGNGRFIRNLLDAAVATQSVRLTTTTTPDPAVLRPEDLPTTLPTPATAPGLYL
ncbi:AAA family ATPase [Actinomadura oligospora]|uniref:AAA family ATPase n=1 Tax=Actinomadura oligospora TaxID=111804 RepID=UPI0004B0E6EE|nr:AAA family ATPase [Actinomadura oligospora]